MVDRCGSTLPVLAGVSDRHVLAPYQLVKDLRTGLEKGNPDAVLDGFMAAALASRVGATCSEASAQAR